MENDIESTAPPPVSSLRSRFEALSRRADSPSGSESSKLHRNVPLTKPNGGASRPTTPTVIVSAARPSEISSSALRRVVSTPTSPPPTSPATSNASSRPNSGYGDLLQGTIAVNGDEEDVPTPHSATPRKTPSTPNFSTAAKGFPIGLGMSSESPSNKPTPRSASGSSIGGHERKNSAPIERAISDVEHVSRKLLRKPPPPPPGKKPPPPPPPRSTDSRSASRAETPIIDFTDSNSSSPSRLQSQGSADSSGSFTLNLVPPRLPTRSSPSPTLPPRSPSMVPLTPQPMSAMHPITPPLPPRSADTATFHSMDRGLKTPSTERLSFSGSDGSENGKPSLIPPRLPNRSGTSSVTHSPKPSFSGPPLPPRGQTNESSSSIGMSLAPPLPPRLAGSSAPASLEDTSSRSTLSVRRVPPPPRSHGSDKSNSPNGSRESLTPVGDPPSAPPNLRTISADSALPPPPTRTVPTDASGHHHHHHHHHFPHLPHQLNSLPITKILAAVKMGGGSSGGGTSGSRSPQGYNNSTNSESFTASGMELNGTAGLPPPPTRNIGDKFASLRPGSSGGRGGERKGSGTSSSDEEEGESGPLVASGAGAANGGQKRPMAKVGEELPDSSRSNRRPPILESFQHPPPLLPQHSWTKNGLHVPAHSGVVAVAGWWVVIAGHGSVTIMNMNPEERNGMMGGYEDHDWSEREGKVKASGKGVWTVELKDLPIDWKGDKPRVTAMEFRPHSKGYPSSQNASRTSFNTDQTRKDTDDQGRFLWCGTKDGCLFELDVMNGGKLMDVRVGAHTGHVVSISKLRGNRMLSIDENGKCLVFCGVGVARTSGENVEKGRWLSRANPRVQRIMHKDGFARVLNGRLWTSAASGTIGSSTTTTSTGSGNLGGGDSKSSLTASVGGSIVSLAATASNHSQHKSHHHHSSAHRHMGPNIRVHDIDDDGAFVARSIVPGHNVGAVTCGTVLPSTPERVYLGHEGGWVTIWEENTNGKTRPLVAPDSRPPLHRQESMCSTTSTSSLSSSDEEDATMIGGTKTDSPANTLSPDHHLGFLPPPPRSAALAIPTEAEGGPVCVAKLKISISDVISLEGVGSRLWAGNRKGSILVYDVTGGSEAGDVEAMANSDRDVTPWVVTNMWKAHGEFPILRIVVDPLSVSKTGQLVVYSIGRDEVLRFWDGFLSQNWIDSEMLTRANSFCTFRPLKVLICTWNIDAAKPDSLVGTNNVTAFQSFLNNNALDNTPPDMIVFGFQEVINLEDKKLTAKTVLLGSSKRNDGTISEKVSKHYRMWHDHLVAQVRKAYPNDSYMVQHTENLVGLFTCVFVRRTLAHPTPSSPSNIRDIGITTIKCGMHGMYGNKGAIVARFTVDDTSFCFLNCHLAAGQSQKVSRNMDLAAILEDKAVFPPSSDIENAGSANPDFVAYVGGGDGSMVLDHEVTFLSGDLNYRIDQRRDVVISNVQNGNLAHLLQYDQLRHEITTNPSFRLHTFIEPSIDFAPTYKYDRNTSTYDTSEKKRIPAWCDRILYRAQDTQRVECLWYGRFQREPDVSDHRPVGGLYRVEVKKVVPEKRARELSVVRRLWEDERLRLAEEARAFFEEYY